MIKNQKIYAFIDSQNLNLGIRDQGWKLDFVKFRLYLKNKYKVDKALIFIGFIEKNRKLYNYLENSGYQLIFKPTVEQNGEVKGNVDAELVLHCMIMYKKFSKAIIVSGDGDFHCLIDYLLKKKKLAKILAPTKRYSSLLREFNNGGYVTCVDLMRDSLEQKKTGIRVRSKP